MKRTEVFEAVVDLADDERRGFDDAWCWMAAFAVPAVTEAQDLTLLRELVEEDVRGSLVAIESIAGWCSRTLPFDLADDTAREQLCDVAEELEDLARGLRAALADRTEKETR